MMKRWLAVLAALAMLVCLVGCGAVSQGETPSENPLPDDLSQMTYEDLLALFGAAEEQDSGPTLSVSYTLYNNNELIAFMEAINAKQPTSYTNTVNELNTEGETVKVTYTAAFDGAAYTLERVSAAGGTETFEITQMGMRQLAPTVATQEEFIEKLALIDVPFLDAFGEQYLYRAFYGIYEICAVTADGQIFTFEYYIDESVDETLAAYGLE